MASWGPEGVDAILYAASALFAGLNAKFSTISLYRVWGEVAVGPYLVAAVASAVLAGRHARRAAEAAELDDLLARAGEDPAARRQRQGRQRSHWSVGQTWVFLVILVGSTLAPLSVEVAQRSVSVTNASAHVQPEVQVIEDAAHNLVHHRDPYHAWVSHGVVQSANPGEPAYESFFPYLPLMAVFGLPSTAHVPSRLTDARIFFSMVTLLVVALALWLCRAPNESKFRTLQFLTVLPTAALPLATGGDDVPIVAFLLLGIVLAQRRQPLASGIVFGIVSAMKFTAWPLVALALFAAYDRRNRRAPLRMLGGILLVMGPVVIPFVLRNPHTFVSNVILFPLGLAGVASPAASPLPGHLIVSAFPSLHRVVPLVAAVIGGGLLTYRLVRRPPTTAGEVATLGGWVMLVAIMVAPATRIGYLLYPLNFFVWGPMLRRAERLRADDDQLISSDRWKRRRVKGVDSELTGAEAEGKVVGSTTAPISQYQPSSPGFWARISVAWGWFWTGPTLKIFHPCAASSLR